MITGRSIAAAALLTLCGAARATAQESAPARISADTAVSLSMFSKNDHVAGMFDATVSLTAGKGLTAIMRPWVWRRPDGTSTFQWYQLHMRYQSRTRLPVRAHAGLSSGVATRELRLHHHTILPRIFLTLY